MQRPASHSMMFITRAIARRSGLALAYLAVLMNLLAGTGWVHAATMGGIAQGFSADICTTKAAPALTSVGAQKSTLTAADVSPPSPSAQTEHDCCGACFVGAPVSVAAYDGVSPAPTGELRVVKTLDSPTESSAYPAHRPRGPPIV